MTISALCMFCGNIPGTNPDAAAAALRAAGYQVFRLPPELKAATCEIEGDDFIEIRSEGDADDDAIDAMRADAQRIVAPFEGDVDCVGAASIEPFAELTLNLQSTGSNSQRSKPTRQGSEAPCRAFDPTTGEW